MEPDPKLSNGVDLGDGFGPFEIGEIYSGGDEELDFVMKSAMPDPEGSGYGDSVAQKAETNYKDIRKGSNLEKELVEKINELRSKIDKAHTKSRNEKVRKRFEEIRKQHKTELEATEDRLKELKLSKGM